MFLKLHILEHHNLLLNNYFISNTYIDIRFIKLKRFVCKIVLIMNHEIHYYEVLKKIWQL